MSGLLDSKIVDRLLDIGIFKLGTFGPVSRYVQALRTRGIDGLVDIHNDELKSRDCEQAAVPFGLALTVSMIRGDMMFSLEEFERWYAMRFAKDYTPAIICPGFEHSFVFPKKFFVLCTVISVILKDEHSSDIQLYTKIAEVLSKEWFATQKVMLLAIENYLGKSVTSLASAVTNENINFIMSTFKFSVNLPLVYEFCTASTWHSKFLKLWQFLEVNDLLWKSIPWSSIQTCLTTIYKILEWLFTKTKLVGDLFQDGVSWVEAKVLGEKTPNSTVNTIVQNMAYNVETETLAQHQAGGTGESSNETGESVEMNLLPPKSQKTIDFIEKHMPVNNVRCTFCLDFAISGCAHTLHYCAQHLNTQPCMICETSQYHTVPCECVLTTDSDISSSRGSSVCSEKLCLEVESEKYTVLDKTKMFIKNLKLEQLGNEIIEFLQQVFTDVVTFFDNYPFFAGLVALATSFASLCGFTLPFFLNQKESISWIKRLTEGMRSAYYCNRGTESLMGTASGLFTTLREMCGVSQHKQIDEFKKSVAAIYLRATEMRNLAISNPGKFINNAQEFAKFKAEMKEVNRVYVDLSKQYTSAQLQVITPIWNQLGKVFFEISRQFQKFVSCLSERPVPVTVWLWGATGIGKSFVLSYICDRINQILGTCMQVMTLCKGPEFWNTYAQQDIIKIDDFGSWIDPTGDKDALAVMNLVTPAAYNPNMAALEDKNTMATPKFLLIAANFPTIPLNSGIQDIQAFERRRHFLVHVSWPEHEAVCPPGCEDCDLFKAMKEKNAGNISDFSHLTFKMCNRICSEPVGADTHISRNRNYEKSEVKMRELNFEKIITNKTVSLEELINMIIGKHREHEQTFQDTINRKIRMGVSLQAPLQSWKQCPTILLNGPPGTGKTTLLEQTCALMKEKSIKHRTITTMLEFDTWFENKDFNHEFVCFSDATPLVSSRYFKQFIDMVCERYDQKDNEIPIWIICANEEILVEAIEESFNEEKVDVFFRRCEVIQFMFKKKNLFQKYTYKDTKQRTASIDKMIRRVHNDDDYSSGQLIELLIGYKPNIDSREIINSLEEITEYEPDTVVNLHMSVDQFVCLASSAKPLSIAKTLVNGKHQFSSNRFTFSQIARKLYTAVRQSGASEGIVLTLDALLIDAINNDTLSAFKDCKILVNFLDKSYALDGSKEFVTVKIYRPVGVKAQDCVDSLNAAIKTIGNADLISVTENLIPPWYAFTADLIMTVLKVATTGYVTMGAVHEISRNKMAIEATNLLHDNINSKVKETMTNVMNSIVNESDSEKYSTNSFIYNRYRQHESDSEKYSTNSYIYNRFRQVEQKESDSDKYSVKDPRRQVEYVDHLPPDYKEMEIPLKDLHDGIIKQMSGDPGLPQVIDAILPNLVEIISEKNAHLVYGLMYEGLKGTTVYHITDLLRDGTLYVRTTSKIVYKAKILHSDPATDRLDFEIVDKTCPAFTTITQHISDGDGVPPYHCQAVLLTFKPNLLSIPVLKIRSYRIEGMEIVKFDQDDAAYHHIKYVGHQAGIIMNDVNTYSGDCGSILLISDTTWHRGKIIGMHVGAGTKEAYARLMCRKDHVTTPNKEFLEELNSFSANCFDPEYVIAATDDRNPAKKGITRKTQNSPYMTNLYRNVAPIGPRTHEPGILSAKDPRSDGESILHKEAAKYYKQRKPLSGHHRRIIRQATEQLADHFADVLARENVQLSVLTRTGALNKLPGCSKSEPINIKTSPGFPYSDISSRAGKQDYISVDKNGIHRFNKSFAPARNALIKGMNAYHAEAQGGPTAPCVFKMFLKDEPRKVEKLHKTRTILAADLALQVEYRRYLHSAQAFCAEYWHLLPPKIGINPLSLDSNTLYHKLRKVGTKCLAEDFKGWDFSPHPHLMAMLPIFWNRIYKRLDPNWEPYHDKMRRVLYAKIICFFFLVGNTIMEATGGVPSGYPGTSPDNSVLNAIIHAACYIAFMLKHHPNLANVFNWLIDVCFADYGDDVIQTFSDWFAKIFDLQFLVDLFKEWGFEVTGASKDEKVKLQPLVECSFLSRSFRFHNGMVLMPLNFDRLWKMTWWVHDSPPYEYVRNKEKVVRRAENSLGAYRSLLFEACLHGVEVFNTAYTAADAARRHFGVNETFPSYAECLQHIFGANGNLNFDPAGFIKEDIDISKVKFRKTYQNQNSVVMKNRIATHFGPAYWYSGVKHKPSDIPTHLQELMDYLNLKYNKKWNSVLINEYPRSGGIPKHKDDEPGLDINEGVGCLTVQGDGTLRLYSSEGNFLEYVCSSGMFYIMERAILQNWSHSRVDHYSPKTISLTFRKLDT
ncbi:hypothetical protein 1 [Hubei picorna-like virus 70]|uniref:hypothetical protein 1 n=1 Tax=Hubei picorna-like virus 70 TaxID=1923154 RepID=UPI00090C8568|nr:hypothetical protein 1 [Hubei picorna-like virus 70]APG77505.1 hypothetical protein 1 [Hubei picorna-like virus 70]